MGSEMGSERGSAEKEEAVTMPADTMEIMRALDQLGHRLEGRIDRLEALVRNLRVWGS